jgi:ATP-dependent DNA ligase
MSTPPERMRWLTAFHAFDSSHVRSNTSGATIFRQACMVGLEGIVSKRLSAPYRSRHSRDWLKVKNPDSPAMIRAREAVW